MIYKPHDLLVWQERKFGRLEAWTTPHRIYFGGSEDQLLKAMPKKRLPAEFIRWEQ